jgi:hypothetical protein
VNYDETRVEAIARKLCAIRGQDPDAHIPHGADDDGSGFVPAILLYSPRWRRVAREVRDRIDMDTAMEIL